MKRKPKARPSKAGPPKIGRPRIEITPQQWAQVAHMAQDMCSNEEIADYLGIERHTLLAPHNRPRFEQITKMKRAATKWSVRKKQREAAEGGQVVGSIWWGKQHLGQADKQQTSSELNLGDRAEGAVQHLAEALDRLAEQGNGASQ